MHFFSPFCCVFYEKKVNEWKEEKTLGLYGNLVTFVWAPKKIGAEIF